jgi:hemolysin D
MLSPGKGVVFNPPPGTPAEVAETQKLLSAAQLAEVNASTASLAAARATAPSDAVGARATVARLTDTGPMLNRQIAAMNRLDVRGYSLNRRSRDRHRNPLPQTGAFQDHLD